MTACPHCESMKSAIIYNKPSKQIKAARVRRRRCKNCGNIWNTLEAPEQEYYSMINVSAKLDKIAEGLVEIMEMQK